MKPKKAFAEISEDGKTAEVFFRYDEDIHAALLSVRAQFVPPEKGGPHWRVPLEYESVKRMALAIGRSDLALGDALKEWARKEKDFEERMFHLANAEDAKLEVVPDRLPKLYKKLRPDQRAGIKFLAEAMNPLNADEPGLGKTWEHIGALAELGLLDAGPHLVVAPVTALDATWWEILQEWQDLPIHVCGGSGWSPKWREEALEEAAEMIDSVQPCWVLVNPDMLRYRKSKTMPVENLLPDFDDPAFADKEIEVDPFPILHEIKWVSIALDEFQKRGIRNPSTPTARGIYALKLQAGGKRFALSGTPMGGKTDNLWGILHYLNPDRYRSKWRWRYQWLEINEGEYGVEVGDVRPELEEAFYRSLSPYVLRRKKSEVLKDLPEKDIHDLWCHMTAKQERQYAAFADDAEIRIGDAEISATIVLAEYTRLKQFAGAARTIEGNHLIATEDSGKKEVLEEKFDELGLFDEGSEVQAIVGSFDESMVSMLYRYFVKKGLRCLFLTGDVTDTRRDKRRGNLIRSFQAGEAQVLFMTAQTGGVSITLDRADHAFVIDESWNPDDVTQFTDRVHRASRIHQVTVWHLRTRRTIDEYIMKTNLRKGVTNKKVLDTRRTMPLYKKKERRSR